MNFKEKYPDFAPIEAHIRRARAERSVAIAVALSEVVMGVSRFLKRFALAAGSGLSVERDRRAIEADAFLKRSVPRY